MIIWLLISLISRIPVWLLRAFSHVLFFFLYHIFRYRRQVVRLNLEHSFPELTGRQLGTIEKGFYHHLSDLFPEMLRLVRIDPACSGESIRFKNPEILKHYLLAGESLVLLTGHTGNWEYGILPLLSAGYRVLAVFKPQSSPIATDLINRIRMKPGVTVVPMKETYRTVKSELERGGPPFILGLVADQTPAQGDIHYWTRFLNQETAFFTGGAKLAHKFSMPVVYMDQKKNGFGKYETTLTSLYDGREEVTESSLTERFVSVLEDTIRRDPRLWLWSHRRWKYQKEKLHLPDAQG